MHEVFLEQVSCRTLVEVIDQAQNNFMVASGLDTINIFRFMGECLNFINLNNIFAMLIKARQDVWSH